MEDIIEEFRRRFEYRDGKLLAKVRYHYKVPIGREAGNFLALGYRQVAVQGKVYLTHRVVWMMHYGEIPEDMCIDHINRKKDDNRLENLRLASTSENALNSNLSSDNTSGVKGVSWNKALHKWGVRLTTEGKYKHLGLYDTLDEATEVVRKAREKLHGDFACCG